MSRFRNGSKILLFGDFATKNIACLCALYALGCGSGLPPEETVYHDPALRPGVVEAVDPSERALLARLGSSDEAIQVDGLTVEAPYAAASARRCRRITGAQTRVACETDGGWVFVPDVLADDPGGEP